MWPYHATRLYFQEQHRFFEAKGRILLAHLFCLGADRRLEPLHV